MRKGKQRIARTSTLEELGGTWRAGDRLVITTPYIIPSAGMWGTNQVYMSIPLGKPVTASEAKVTVLDGNVRQNTNVLVDAGSMLAKGTVKVTLHKEIGLVTILLTLSSAPSNAQKSTAICVALNKLEIEFI